jgi:N-carbamoylputrescine amidase
MARRSTSKSKSAFKANSKVKSRIVNVGLTQMACVEDVAANRRHQAKLIEQAAKAGAQIVCTQEMFASQYFCQSEEHRFFKLAETIPGPSTDLFCKLAKKHNIVIVASLFEKRASGLYHNTAAVIDADGTYLGKYRKQHIPQTKGFWEKYYFTPGTGGYPVFNTAVGKVGVYICYDRHFPEGWRALGLNGAEIVFNPSATSRGLSEYLWRLEQPASAVANIYYVGAINRVGIEPLGDNDFYGQSYFVDPEGKMVGDVGDPFKPELIVRDLDLDMIRTVRDRWAFYRDRRPDAYDELTAR